MTTHPAEAARQYSLSHGGHASTAGTLGVSQTVLQDYMHGNRPATRALAVALSPLIGVAVPIILAADPDIQFMARRGAQN